MPGAATAMLTGTAVGVRRGSVTLLGAVNVPSLSIQLSVYLTGLPLPVWRVSVIVRLRWSPTAQPSRSYGWT